MVYRWMGGVLEMDGIDLHPVPHRRVCVGFRCGVPADKGARRLEAWQLS